MKNAILLSILLTSTTILHAQPVEETEEYPYVLPLLAQKAVDRGMGDQLQLPFGLNINYVNAFVDLEVTEFELLLNGNDLSGIINSETLNFTQTDATTNGVNLRADAWILPFMNVYAMVSIVQGGTNVMLQPTWKNSEGEVILQLPEFGSSVSFDARAYGVGSTFIFGWDGYFSSMDVNYSRATSAILEDAVGYLTLSGRLGYRFPLSKRNDNIFVAPYVGVMYRDFVGDNGNRGAIGFDDVFPGADESFNTRIDDKMAENQAKIDDPNTPNLERIKLQAENQALENIQDGVNDSGLFQTEINYFIRKEMIQSTTFQFGFNFQMNKNWMLRGEYGVSGSQRFLMTGVQYRFGL